MTGDAWDGRTLEWATSSAIPPHYNFAHVPEVKSVDAFHYMKQEWKESGKPEEPEYKPIHMPNNAGVPFIMSGLFFVAGFGLVFELFWLAILALVGIFGTMAHRSLTSHKYDKGYYVTVDEIEKTENRFKREA
jgi:cytochrome aa3-600 menaquinol oxidase subunit I